MPAALWHQDNGARVILSRDCGQSFENVPLPEGACFVWLIVGFPGRFGTPSGWQSRHLTRWMLCRLVFERYVVSMSVTARPHDERAG